MTKPDHARTARAESTPPAILVVVHPYATAGGPPDTLDPMSELVANWEGNVFVLADRGGNPNASLEGSHFLDVLFDRTAAAEDRGEIRRIFADEEKGELYSAIDKLSDLTPENAEYTITGASLEGVCATVAKGLNELGCTAVIDGTAISEEDYARAALHPAEDDDLIHEILHCFEEG